MLNETNSPVCIVFLTNSKRILPLLVVQYFEEVFQLGYFEHIPLNTILFSTIINSLASNYTVFPFGRAYIHSAYLNHKFKHHPIYYDAGRILAFSENWGRTWHSHFVHALCGYEQLRFLPLCNISLLIYLCGLTTELNSKQKALQGYRQCRSPVELGAVFRLFLSTHTQLVEGRHHQEPVPIYLQRCIHSIRLVWSYTISKYCKIHFVSSQLVLSCFRCTKFQRRLIISANISNIKPWTEMMTHILPVALRHIYQFSNRLALNMHTNYTLLLRTSKFKISHISSSTPIWFYIQHI